MNKTTKSRRGLLLLMTLLLILVMGSTAVDASTYYYFKKPADGKTVTAGTKIPVSFWAGGVRTYTKMDAWGNPESTTYQKMPAEVRIYKGSTEIFSKEFQYTKGAELKFSYTPKLTGTLKLKLYGTPISLDDNSMLLQDTIKIKVKKIKPAAVKKVKPVISAERTAKNKAVITCTANYGYGIKIYRATAKNGKYKLVKTLSAGKTSFTNTGLKGSKIYYYKARIFAAKGKKTYQSKYSAVTSAGKYNSSQDRSALMVTVVNTSSGVRISWKKQSKAGYYLVGRFTDPKGEAEETWCGGENDLTWTDKNAVKGKTYYYIVSAWHGNDTMPLVKCDPVKIKVS